MQKQRVTIKDLAKALNLSTSTVSRALADSWDVNPDTRDAVLALAEKMKYKPNPASHLLKQKQTFTIGVIIPEFINSFFPEVIMGIQAVLEPQQYQLLISQSNESAEVELKNMKSLEDKMVDGFIVSCSAETEENLDYYKYLIESKIPIVFFNRVMDKTAVSQVIIDDYKWAFQATEHLIDQGCRRIMHLAGPDNIDVTIKRKAGYVDALKRHGLPCGEDMIISCGIMMEGGVLGAMKILEQNKYPDGIFAVNDPVAIGAMKTLQKGGIKIPDDIAIMGFTESKMAMIVEPNLTSIEQPTYEMGKAAAELLLNQIKSVGEVSQRTIILEAKLNVRESTLHL